VRAPHLHTHLRFLLPPLGLTRWWWTKTELLANVLLVQNLLHVKDMLFVLWSLPIEVQMYVFLPFLFLLGSSIRIRTMLLLWCGTVAIALFQPRIGPRADVLAYAPCFLPGIIAWMISSKFRPRLPGYLWPFALTAISLIGLVIDLRQQKYFSWAFCLMVGLVVPQFADVRSAWLNAVTKTIAKYSYGIYLSHAMAMSIAFTVVHNRAGQYFVLLVLASTMPIAMYHLIEHPGIRLGKKLADKITVTFPRSQELGRLQEKPDEVSAGAGGVPDVGLGRPDPQES
jgi:peptidoglycan/LPS O-acetylase OafA/YrhL